MRQPRDNETLCKFGCQTIVSKDLASCEMCCDEAVSARVARLIPIEAADKIKSDERTAAMKLLAQARREELKRRLELQIEKIDAADALPQEGLSAKKRGRPSKDAQ